jgi:hypothetical protein
MSTSIPGKADEGVPLVGLIAIIAGAMGLYLWLVPLQTFRPPVQEDPRPPLERPLPARLWQDPIQQARQSVTRPVSGVVQGKVEALPKLAANVRVLAVTVYGGYGQLEHETRLRSRYAVELALNDEGYVPDSEDSEFLRFLALNWGDDSGKKSCKVLPFERWRNEGAPCILTKPTEVLVLWIDDTLLGDKPREKLWNLMGLAGIQGKIRKELVMIGPSDSSGLRNLITEQRECEKKPTREERECDWPKEINSPWATADEVFLFRENENLDKMQLPAGIHRTVATDRQLCGKLVDELGKRDIRLREGLESKGDDTIAVLSEWDTVYGRALPVTFAACVLMAGTGSNCGADDEKVKLEFRKKVRNLLKDKDKWWPPEVLPVVYLRGLDGIGPHSPAQAQEPANQNKSFPADIERTYGTSQLDYTRRLAEWLKESCPSLRAVGVLGSDIYDKLLLLQALRERVPGSIFFTTDLDAGYLHPSQNNWSRNLLVASSFDLSEKELDPKERKVSPPFRDTYGVAIVRAVRRAISGIDDKTLNVSMYEIGRGETHQLDAGKKETSNHLILPLAVLLLLMMLLTGILLMMHMGPSFFWYWLATLAFLLAVLGLICAGQGQEPLAWLEGVSIWPTEIIRLVAVATAMVLLMTAHRSMRENFRKIALNCGFPEQTSDKKEIKPRWLWPWMQLLTEAPKADAKGQLEVISLWHCYEATEEAAGRWWRAGSLAGFILVAFGVTLMLERPMRPFRGVFGDRVDLAIAVLSMAALLLTTCYVADATATCTRWIRCMINVRTTWLGGGGDSASDLPDAWRDVEIVAQRTQAVGHLILYPFFLLLLLILSRSQVFDRWTWPGSLVTIFSLPLGLALISALMLRRSAEQLRSKSYAEVRVVWDEALRGGDGGKAELAESAMKSIEAESRGAFSPVTQNPALVAILLPLSGAGTGLALEKLLQNL